MEENKLSSRIEKFTFNPFEKEKQTWEDYILQFEIMCKVKGLDGSSERLNEARRDLLLVYMGKSVFSEARRHFMPTPIEECSYSELKEGMKSLFQPAMIDPTAIINFEQAVREKNESLRGFGKRLKELSHNCDFGVTSDRRLRDRFVAEINNEYITREIGIRCLEAERNGISMTFDEIIDLAIDLKSAEKDAKYSSLTFLTRLFPTVQEKVLFVSFFICFVFQMSFFRNIKIYEYSLHEYSVLLFFLTMFTTSCLGTNNSEENEIEENNTNYIDQISDKLLIPLLGYFFHILLNLSAPFSDWCKQQMVKYNIEYLPFVIYLLIFYRVAQKHFK